MPPLLANRNDKSMCDRLLVMWTKEHLYKIWRPFQRLLAYRSFCQIFMEDDILRDQVKLHGIDRWAKIAGYLCGKTSRQCRRRWHMFLNVVNKRGGWSADEDKLLLETHRKFGNRWTEIAKRLPGRTDNAVKNRFCVLCKKQTREAEPSPLQRSVGTSSGNFQRKLQDRRSLEGPKLMHSMGGPNKRLRTAAGHDRIRTLDVSTQQGALDQKLKQCKEQKSLEGLPNPLQRHVSPPKKPHPWSSSQSGVLVQQHMSGEAFCDWRQLALEGTGRSNQSWIQGNSQRELQGSSSGIGISAKGAPQLEEPPPMQTLQALVTTKSPLSESRMRKENLQRWKRENSVEVSNNHRQQATWDQVNNNHSVWLGGTAVNAVNNRPDSEMLNWWKGANHDIVSQTVHQQRETGVPIHEWDQSSQVSGFESGAQRRRANENLTPSFATVYMSDFKESIGGMQTWADSTPKEAGDDFSPRRSKDFGHQWHDWNAEVEDNQSPLQRSTFDKNLRMNEPNRGQVVETVSLQEVTVKRLELWMSTSSQQATSKTVLQKPDRPPTQQWKASKRDTLVKCPCHLLQGELTPDDTTEAVVNRGLSVERFSGTENHGARNCQLIKESKSQVVGKSWKTSIKKLEHTAALFSGDTRRLKCPREVLALNECMPEGRKDMDIKGAEAFLTSTTPIYQALKAEHSTWESLKNVECDGHEEMNSIEGFLPECGVGCETNAASCEESNDAVELKERMSESSGANGPLPPDTPTGSVHCPTETVPGSQLTVECMPSPQFTDSEKEFLLSTLDQLSTNCSSSSPMHAVEPPSTNHFSSSPLRQQSRFSKVRNSLMDIRYDTPARSPLSTCLLRQFQASETSRFA